MGYRSRSRSYSPPRGGGGGYGGGYGGGGGGSRGGGGGGGRRNSPPQSGRSLLVRNLGRNVRMEDLRYSFEKYGPVKDIYLPKDYYTGELRGFGFVQYIDPEAAADAQYNLDRTEICGREVTVVFAEESRKTPQEMRSKERKAPPPRGRTGYPPRRSPFRGGRSRSPVGRRGRSPSPPPRGRRYSRRSYSRSRSPTPRRRSPPPRRAYSPSPPRGQDPPPRGDSRSPPPPSPRGGSGGGSGGGGSPRGGYASRSPSRSPPPRSPPRGREDSRSPSPPPARESSRSPQD
eukprot:jgi/Mesvir1/22832/Mv20092-RA.1